jgi:ureidoglycolate lyase
MTLKPEALTKEAFAPYGSFFDPAAIDAKPVSKEPVRFYPDQHPIFIKQSNYASVSSLILEPRPLVIDCTEYHEYCEEFSGGFGEDTVFHVGLPDSKGKPELASFKVFSLPRGWYLRFKCRVCHMAPYVCGKNTTAGIVILPPYTYTVDCVVIKLQEKIEITL